MANFLPGRNRELLAALTRFAAGEIAASSPPIQRSNGESPGSMVRSNAAIAWVMASTSIGFPGSAALNFAT